MTIVQSGKMYLKHNDQVISSAELATRIAATDFSHCAATVIGYGNMGRQYVKALQALGVKRIRVCSRSDIPLQELKSVAGVETIAGGFEHLQCSPQSEELCIVAAPTLSLFAASERVVSLGFRRLLLEKPVALSSNEIEWLAEKVERIGVEAKVAYNRIAYPSFLEARTRTAQEGEISSCTYTFTEWPQPDWGDRFPSEELARWGIANSLHVVGMAHRLIGWPMEWNCHRAGSLSWHPAGRVFVGSGVSAQGIPFSYHADWGSTGRWSVEVHTAVSSYRLCPLEKLFRRTCPTGDWEEVSLVSFTPDIKVGFVEQVAAMLSGDIRPLVPLVSLREAATLTRYGEDVFGYAKA